VREFISTEDFKVDAGRKCSMLRIEARVLTLNVRFHVTFIGSGHECARRSCR
jgi:hypothetical protein